MIVLSFKIDFTTDSVFSSLNLANRIASILFLDTLVNASLISFGVKRNEVILAPLNCFSYFLIAESPFFWTFFNIVSTMDLFF